MEMMFKCKIDKCGIDNTANADCVGCGDLEITPLKTQTAPVAKLQCSAGVICRCQNVEMGSYGNQIWVHAPTHMPKENGYCLDRCVAEEVMQLWMKGITTTGCCCGHQTEHTYIGVTEEDIPKMKEMGYKVAPNKSRPGAEDSFYPKGI